MTISKFSFKVWNSIKFEIIKPLDVETQALAIGVSQSLLRGLLESDQGLRALLDDILGECKALLNGLEIEMIEASGLILNAIISTSPVVLDYVLKVAIARLISLFQVADDIKQKVALIDVVRKLVDTTANQDNVAHRAQYFNEYADNIWALSYPMLNSNVKDQSFAILNLYSSLITIPNIVIAEKRAAVNLIYTRYLETSDGMLRL